MHLVIQNIIRFVILVLVQVFVLDNIQFLGYINPMIYILFILSLPVRLPQWAQLLLAFALGITIDMFSNTIGMHAFSAVFIAFFRNLVISVLVTPDDVVRPTPSFSSLGITPYLKYVVILVLIHHTVLFLIEAFTFSNIALLLPKILLSSLVTILLIFASKSLFNFDRV